MGKPFGYVMLNMQIVKYSLALCWRRLVILGCDLLKVNDNFISCKFSNI